MKYMGNKNRIAADILRVMLEKNENNVFVDLFCGGCSVIEKVPTTFRRIANDKNRYLIEMFKELCKANASSAYLPFTFPRYIPRYEYNKRRDLYNKEKKGLVTLTDEEYAEIGWFGWMGSFNGRFFSGGYSGHEVVIKNGTTRDYITEGINNTLLQIPYLQGVEFHCADYADVEIPLGSIVYCDIPYKGTKQYETSKDFDYERFYEWCRANKDRYHIFISEYAMPDDFECVWAKSVTNAMNTTKTYRPVEKLFILT